MESVGDPESTPALQEDAGDERTSHHGEIRSPPCRVEVALDDAEAPSAPLRHGYEADSRVVLGVEIVCQGDAGDLGRVDERLGEDVPLREIGERERRRGTTRERRLDVVPGPP